MQHLIIIADILLHVAGLAVVTEGIKNDKGVKIIMPRVHYTDPFTTLTPIDVQMVPDMQMPPDVQRRSATPVPAQAAPAAPAPAGRQPVPAGRFGAGTAEPFLPHGRKHVQDHKAMLIFRTATLVYKTPNWPVVNLIGEDAGYSYVVLDHDFIRLETNYANAPANLAAVVLPRLNMACCAQMGTLSPAFLPPYQGAAAVFDIAEGLITSCDADTLDGNGRRDTEIRLIRSNGWLVVSASTMTTTKELRFKVPASGNLELVAANLPEAYLAGVRTIPPADAIDGLDHFYAYYAMGGGQSASCTKSLHACFGTPPPSPCSVTNFAHLAGKTMNVPQTDDSIFSRTRASNFECSNSSWP